MMGLLSAPQDARTLSRPTRTQQNRQWSYAPMRFWRSAMVVMSHRDLRLARTRPDQIAPVNSTAAVALPDAYASPRNGHNVEPCLPEGTLAHVGDDVAVGMRARHEPPPLIERRVANLMGLQHLGNVWRNVPGTDLTRHLARLAPRPGMQNQRRFEVRRSPALEGARRRASATGSRCFIRPREGQGKCSVGDCDEFDSIENQSFHVRADC
jgi:hypothetical protein